MTMNSNLEQQIRDADGRYLTDNELDTLDTYVETYALRLSTYTLLQEKAEDYILQSLQLLSKTDARTVELYHEKCVQDMGYVVRAIAVAILRDDEIAFRQELLLWMQNILTALHKEKQSSRAYRLLQTVINTQMPPESAALVDHYLDEFITALKTGTA